MSLRGFCNSCVVSYDFSCKSVVESSLLLTAQHVGGGCARLLILSGVESIRLSRFGHCKTASIKDEHGACLLPSANPDQHELTTWIYNVFHTAESRISLSWRAKCGAQKHQETRDSATRSEFVPPTRLYILKCDQERDPIDIWMPPEGNMCEPADQPSHTARTYIFSSKNRQQILLTPILNMAGRRYWAGSTPFKPSQQHVDSSPRNFRVS